MWLFAIFFTTFFTTALSALGADPQPGIIGHDHKPRESKPPVRLALYQPDIPQNAAALMRLGACLGVAVELIEPCGFVFGERRFRRAGMDYLEAVELTRHSSWDAFEAWRCGAGRPRRLLGNPLCSCAFMSARCEHTPRFTPFPAFEHEHIYKLIMQLPYFEPR